MAQPPYVSAQALEPHQLAGAAQLRRMYVHAHDCILADDPALGMVATLLTFLQARRPPSLLFLKYRARACTYRDLFALSLCSCSRSVARLLCCQISIDTSAVFECWMKSRRSVCCCVEL